VGAALVRTLASVASLFGIVMIPICLHLGFDHGYGAVSGLVYATVFGVVSFVNYRVSRHL
jgi:hypothetical protein